MGTTDGSCVRPLEIGFVPNLLEAPRYQHTPRWEEIRRNALRAEEAGFDTVWIPDELLYKVEAWGGGHGFWECVAVTGALAAATSSIKIGTWVLSALHRNPGLTAKVAETLDEISGGRFVFGYGSGHAGAQGKTYGYPEDQIVGRYEEALSIVVPALRNGSVDFAGQHFSAWELEHRPRGPRPGSIPIMLAGHGPRTMRLAVESADIWSGFATKSSLPEAFADMLANLDVACEKGQRDPLSLGRSIGVFVDMLGTSDAEELGFGVPLSGSPQEVADAARQFAAMGVTQLELVILNSTDEHMDLAAEVVSILDS